MFGRLIITLCMALSALQTADCYVSSPSVSTFAGEVGSSAGFGGDGGAATSASMDSPNSVWVDSTGRGFVADEGNNRIRMISSDGIISTLFGDGDETHTGDGGKATSATGYAVFVAGDTAGHLYFSDDDVVRKIDLSTGILTTFAGLPKGKGVNPGSPDDGTPATSAFLDEPKGVTVDTAGNVYIACLHADKVRVIKSSTLTMETVGGNGQGEVDDKSIYYYHVDPTKDGDGGAATSANVVRPYTLFLNTVGQLYIGEEDGKSIRVIDLSSGIVSLVADTRGQVQTGGDGGQALDALIDPGCITGDENSHIFLSQTSQNSIRYIEYTEQIIDSFAGFSNAAGVTIGSFNKPAGLFASSGVLYVADKGNNAVQAITYSIPSTVSLEGTVSLFAGNPNGGSDLSGPTGGWVNSVGTVYVADHGNARIGTVDGSGIITTYLGNGDGTIAGDGGPAASAGGSPFAICGDSATALYFVDNGVIRKIDMSTNIVSALAGKNGGSLNDNIKATAAEIYPQSCAVDVSGNVYTSHMKENKVKKVTVSTNLISTVAGNGDGESANGYYYFFTSPAIDGDGGPATSAMVPLPAGLFADTTNQLFISQYDGKSVRKVDLASGIITNVAGIGHQGYNGDGGPATAAYLKGFITSLAGDTAGRLFYCSTSFHNIRYIDTNSGLIYRFAGDYTAAGAYDGDNVYATAALFDEPQGIFTGGGKLYVPDKNNNALRVISYDVTSVSDAPSDAPTLSPTMRPTVVPTTSPSRTPSATPTQLPSQAPTAGATLSPSQIPSTEPSLAPSTVPSVLPTSAGPTYGPTLAPSKIPSIRPTMKPSVRPTRMSVLTNSPTFAHTASPTQASVDISFNSDIYLHNVTADHLDSTSQSAVTTAVAVTLDIDTTQVTYLSQQLIGTEGGGAAARRRLSASEAYQIMVSVNVWASTRDFEDATNKDAAYLYEKLSTILDDAVNTNEFALTVRSTSAELGAEATRFVGRVNLTRTDYEVVTPESGGHHRFTDTSTGAYAGVVIGVVMGAMLLAMCVYYAIYLRDSQENEEKQRNESGVAQV